MQESRSDPRNQKVVLARKPTGGGSLVKLAINGDTLRSVVRLAKGGEDKLGQYCGLVHGNVWAVADNPDLRDEGTLGLTEPVAIFQGLKRPRDHTVHDEDTLIYVTNPVVNYTYPPASTTGPRRQKVPRDSVFVTYVDYTNEAVDRLREAVTYNIPSDIVGVVSDWEWVKASPSDSRLPIDSLGSNPRYTRQIWDARDD